MMSDKPKCKEMITFSVEGLEQLVDKMKAQHHRIAELERQLGRLAECGDWPLCDVRRVAREAIDAARKERG